MAPALLTLTRHAATPWGTFGKLALPSGDTFSTLERNWLDNAPQVSCIPPGRYRLELVESPLVERITLGKHRRAFRLCAVPDRSAILIHPGNFENDSRGCILLGAAVETINGRPGVVRSQAAFAAFMLAMPPSALYFLSVAWATTQPHQKEL